MNGKPGSTIANLRAGMSSSGASGLSLLCSLAVTAWCPGVVKALSKFPGAARDGTGVGRLPCVRNRLDIAPRWLTGVFIILIAGQVLGGMVFSQYSRLDSPVPKIVLINIIGALVMIGKVFLSAYTKAI
jgi:hypothetical protein